MKWKYLHGDLPSISIFRFSNMAAVTSLVNDLWRGTLESSTALFEGLKLQTKRPWEWNFSVTYFYRFGIIKSSLPRRLMLRTSQNESASRFYFLSFPLMPIWVFLLSACSDRKMLITMRVFILTARKLQAHVLNSRHFLGKNQLKL